MQKDFIKSILSGILPPTLIIVENSEGKNLLIDGLQRYTAIKKFVEGKLKIDWNGSPARFEELPSQTQNKFLNVIPLPILMYSEEADLKPNGMTIYDLFIKYNKTARVLNQPELLRVIMAQFNPDLPTLLDELAKPIKGNRRDRFKSTGLVARLLSGYTLIEKAFNDNPQEFEKIQKFIDQGKPKLAYQIFKAHIKVSYQRFFDYLEQGIPRYYKKTPDQIREIVQTATDMLTEYKEEALRKGWMMDVLAPMVYARLNWGIVKDVEPLIEEFIFLTKERASQYYAKYIELKSKSRTSDMPAKEMIIAQLVNNNIQKPNYTRLLLTEGFRAYLEL
jgi:hypothetical protein